MSGGAGLLSGVLLGSGVFGLWWSCWVRPPRPRRVRRTPVADVLRAAGADAVPAALLPVASVLLALVAGVVVLSLTQVGVLALGAAVAAGAAPVLLLRSAARRRAADRTAEWPDVVDTLASSVRAGTSLPDAVCALALRGPERLRPAFAGFAHGYRTSGAFDAELGHLADALADPVFDRLAATLRMTRQVGGSDLGGTLRTLSAYLREDARTRSELLARQSWTVSAARLSAAAPWIVLALLATRPGALAPYDSPDGAFVLTAGALVTVVAYRLMVRIGRLPAPRRVLR